MTRAWDWLIGSPTLRVGEGGAVLALEHPVPAWAWALIALAAALVAWAGYVRVQGSPWARAVLGTCRALLLVLVALLLAGPRIVQSTETEEKDWVLVLVDRSASMMIADVQGSDTSARSREAQLREMLTRSSPALERLARDRRVVWLGFEGSASELRVNASGLPELADPTGRRTDIGRAVEQALKRAAGKPLSGVVILSDGRSTPEPGKGLVRRLENEKIPVFAVGLGDPRVFADVAVRRVEAPRQAFVNDGVPVEVELERLGAPGEEAGASERERSIVELVDRATGAVLDSREIGWGPQGSASPASTSAGVRRVTLSTRGASAGATQWVVRVRPAPGSPPDMVQDNNSARVSVELVERPLRVAYFDGYPRWEYRYLKNLLVREQSIQSAVMLLSPGRRYIQEGSITLDTLPRSPEEWAKFDVIVMGDVWPGVFTTEQLAQIKDRVSVGGAGLVWIGGEGATPGAWRSTPLGDVLPMTFADLSESEGGSVSSSGRGRSGLDGFNGPLTIAPTAAADRLGVLRLADKPDAKTGWLWPNELSDPSFGWNVLRWAQRIEPSMLKPTAEVLAMATPVESDGGVGEVRSAGASSRSGAWPVVLSMRYGAGRVLYVGTDEIWRWRYARGELLPERFYIQLVRLLGRESLSRSGRPAIVEVLPERSAVDQPVRVQVTLLDQALVEKAPGTIRVRLTRAGNIGGVAAGATPASDGQAGEVAAELVLGPEQGQGASESGSALASGTTRGVRTYAGTWVPQQSGRYVASVIEPGLVRVGESEQPLTASAEVWQPDDELRQPQTDHEALRRLAEATGGRLLSGDELSSVGTMLPNRAIKIVSDPKVHTLWDTPLALLLVVLLVTLEWVGRRLIRLV